MLIEILMVSLEFVYVLCVLLIGLLLAQLFQSNFFVLPSAHSFCFMHLLLLNSHVSFLLKLLIKFLSTLDACLIPLLNYKLTSLYVRVGVSQTSFNLMVNNFLFKLRVLSTLFLYFKYAFQLLYFPFFPRKRIIDLHISANR